MKDAARSMQLGRRGFTPAVDHPADGAAHRRRVRGAGAIVTAVLLAISTVELAWILAR